MSCSPLPLIAALLASCAYGAPPSSVPDNHGVNRDGVWHARGSDDPEGNCSSCHGIAEATPDRVDCVDCHSAASIASGRFEDEDERDD
jgi:hypothetical protein